MLKLCMLNPAPNQPMQRGNKEVPGANLWLLPMLWPTDYREVGPTPNHLQVSGQAQEQARGNREQAQGNRLCTAAKVKPEKRLFSEIQDALAPALHVHYLTRPPNRYQKH